MMFDLFVVVQDIGKFLDLVGVVIILGGTLLSTIKTVMALLSRQTVNAVYAQYRRNLGRSILLGLEFLVAGDIIRSVTGEPSFTSVGVLAIIVIIRSFLSITFEMEVDGKWPWQRGKQSS